MKNNLKIAFITSVDPLDKTSWSGTTYRMYQALSKQFEQVDALGPVNPWFLKILPLFNRLSRLLLKKGYNYNQSFLRAVYLGKIFNKKLKKKKYDVIFAPAASTEIAFIKTSIPICHLSDSSFGQLNGYYDVFTNLYKFSEKESNSIEYKALTNAKSLIFPSNWAANFVHKHYNIDSSIINIIPFGANIENQYFKEKLAVKSLKNSQLNLLFIGVNWERKGGDTVYKTFQKLLQNGIDTQLTICGCTPPVNHPKMQVFPFLNKNLNADMAILADIYLHSHFLFVPTKADCSPIVFSEACGFGLPIITNKTGGVSEIVIHDHNGICLEYHASVDQYYESILALLNDDLKYQQMRLNAFHKYQDELNWDKWSEKTKEVLIKTASLK